MDIFSKPLFYTYREAQKRNLVRKICEEKQMDFEEALMSISIDELRNILRAIRRQKSREAKQ